MAGSTARSVKIEAATAQAPGGFVQRLRCKQKQWYRIELLLRAPGAESAAGRFEVRLEQFDKSGRSLASECRCGPSRSDSPLVWREYLFTAPGAATVELSILRVGGTGRGDLGPVRFIAMEPPEALGHPLAVPPPPRAYPPPRTVRKVELVGDDVPAALREALIARFGHGHVRSATTAAFSPDGVTGDGVVLYDDPPAETLPSWKALLELAASRLVVISPTLFARLAGRAGGGPIVPRTIRQENDPICVSVRDADFVTRGFALLDVFAYSRYSADRGAFELRCLRRTSALRAFLQRQKIAITLLSETATDATTELPVCLVRPTSGGAVVVLDLAPFASSPCTQDVLNLAAFVLFNALGQSQFSAGQYVVPATDASSIAGLLKELVERFEPLHFAEANSRSAPDRAPPVMLGGQTEGFGLPVAERPTVLIRTGFGGGEWAGLYAVMLWFKDLLRHEPWCAPHARELLWRYRFVLEPIAGSAELGRLAAHPRTGLPAVVGGTGKASVVLAIDVATADRHACRVVVHDQGGVYFRRLAEMLPRLDAELRVARPTLLRPGDGADPADRASYRWRHDLPPVEVIADESATTGLPEAAHVRVELPRWFDETGSNSLWQTERAVTLLEWLVGLRGGLLAVNRGSTQRTVSLAGWLADGQPVVLSADGRRRPAPLCGNGDGRPGTVRLPSGDCLVVRLPADAPPARTAAARRPRRR